jgi:hypothetical protein
VLKKLESCHAFDQMRAAFDLLHLRAKAKRTGGPFTKDVRAGGKGGLENQDKLGHGGLATRMSEI